MDLDFVIKDNWRFLIRSKETNHINAHYNWRKLKSAHRAGAELSIYPYPHWVANPDSQDNEGEAVIQTLRSGRGGGAGLQKRFFPPFGPQFGIKIRGRRDPAPSCPSPGSAAAPNPLMSYFDISCNPPPKNANFPPYNALGTYSPPPSKKECFRYVQNNLANFFLPC